MADLSTEKHVLCSNQLLVHYYTKGQRLLIQDGTSWVFARSQQEQELPSEIHLKLNTMVPTNYV